MHALPLAADIMRARPDSTVDWLAEEGFASIPLLSTHVAHVRTIALRRWRWRPFNPSVWHQVRVAKSGLKDARYDLVLDAQGLAKSAWLARWTGAPIAGFDSTTAREPIAARFYQHRIEVPRGLHAIERCRLLGATALGYAVDGAPEFGLQPKGLSVTPRERFAVLLTNASRETKLWADDRWLAVERWLAERDIASMLFCGSAAERRRTEALAARMQRAEVSAPAALDSIAGTMAAASIVIGLDTGLTHLAAALGRPAVGVYCDYDPALVGLTGDARAGNKVASVGSATTPPTAGEVIEAAMRVMGRAA